MDRHDCVMIIIKLLLPIAAILQQLNKIATSEGASHEHVLSLSVSYGSFLISLHTAAKALALTLPVSKALQAVSIDLQLAPLL